MKIVIDTNVLFTWFWNKSILQNILQKKILTCYAPQLALNELQKYRQEIQEKANISQKEFTEKLELLKKEIEFVSSKNYSENYKTLDKQLQQNKMYEGFKNDIDFLALATYLSCPLWSNDKLLKEQNIATTCNTKEIILLLSDIFV